MKTINLESKVIEAIAGHFEETFRLIEDRFHVRLSARGNAVTVSSESNGEGDRVADVADLLAQLSDLHDQGVTLGRAALKTAVELKARQSEVRLAEHFIDSRIQISARKTVFPSSANQKQYIEAIGSNDLVFGVGPAGTGKTYLAVAMAVAMLNQERVKRIILTRPAVEAGERLGFLPGDLAAKVDPYLRPLYDALYDLLEPAQTERFLEQGVIEVAPLAFMRGRTLDYSFMILDEAQNTTNEQMKMFLTRTGFHSKVVVTGDVTQVDLPYQTRSGLVIAQEVIRSIKGIRFVQFNDQDVVRHPLVQRIILAYEKHKLTEQNRTNHIDRRDDASPESTSDACGENG
jgi:phosphate starvation-inducible PhoH-like protein